jgi:hypothetical protein
MVASDDIGAEVANLLTGPAWSGHRVIELGSMVSVDEVAGQWTVARQSSGHVWQGRYYSCPSDETHLWEALRYTELNPLRAALVREAESCAWSRAASHCSTQPAEICRQTGLSLREAAMPLLAKFQSRLTTNLDDKSPRCVRGRAAPQSARS